MNAFGPLDCLTSVDKTFFESVGFGPTIRSPFECVHHAFEHHAITHPDALAVIDFSHQITYIELERQANCLARQLRAAGIGPNARVCILVERCINMVVGILAVLKAGAAYVPLDGNVVSDATLKHVLADSGASVVLVLRKFAPRVSGTPVLCLEDVVCKCDLGSHCEKPLDESSPDDSVYVIYTSGTTGIAKGVDVQHRNVTNLVCLAPGNLGMSAGLRVSQLMNIAFDMAAWEILGSLCNGATLCLRGKTSKEWRTVMGTVDIVIATPSMLLSHNPSDYHTIKTVAVAGEACSQATADSWGKSVQFYNCCGPTEITIVNTMQLHVPGQPLSIGKPTPNNNVYILDEYLQPLPIGHVGVMWAGGAGITRGYLNLTQITAERYKPDPFTNDGSPMFNTGDLGRWRHDGTLEHLGRIDDQVKIKGFRVELDGVASSMETCPGVKAAAALLIDETLWGFVTPAITLTDAVREAASKIQPYYAVPSHIMALEAFPETANGKTDKRALRRLALDQAATDNVSEASSSEVQLRIVTSNHEIANGMNLPTNPPPVHLQDSTRLRPGNNAAASLGTLGTLTEKGVMSSLTSSTSTVNKSDSLNNTSSSDEKGLALAWAGYEDDDVPDKTQGHYVRNLRHQIFTLYRRLFGVVFITNMAIFIAVLCRGTNALQIGEIAIANLLCAILMRQDYVINMFFNVFCSVPTSWPLSIRRVCARVYHIGGLHSGCAVSGVVWLTLFAGQATKELVEHQKMSIATVAVTYCILFFLFGIVLLAHPTFRSKHHDSFERAHRFLGWTATAMVWAQVVLLTNDHKDPGQSLGHALTKSAAFWMVVVMTGSIILPWIRLRKVTVRSEVLSSHAVRLYFDYTTPITGSFTRVSENPLFEWHGFATIPEPGMKGYSLVVSRAGDWTNKQITEPPTKLWVRGVPAFGVIRIVPLFRRVILVATGSGIGPCAPAILEGRVPMRLLWTSPDVRKTFGDKLVDSILDAQPEAVIYDTRTHGKPDMVKLTYRLVKEFNAEAVCIISNQKLTRKVVYGMMSRGIPAFGAIWDS